MLNPAENTVGYTQTLFAQPLSEEDLEAYFNRIGYKGKPEASQKCLKELHRLHPLAIPFESLNPFLGLPVFLDKDNLQRKLIQEGRGGYCFEHNLLFGQVLTTLGFRVKGLSARVLWNVPEGIILPRDHMLLLVDTAKTTFIADVGFGGNTLTAPLLLESREEQKTSHEPFRILRENELFDLQIKIEKKWKPLYRFSLEPQLLPDYEVTSWYLCNHQDSHFLRGLTAGICTHLGRYSLQDNNLSIHLTGGATEKRTLHTVEELKQVLEENFRIRLPQIKKLDEKLARAITVE